MKSAIHSSSPLRSGIGSGQSSAAIVRCRRLAERYFEAEAVDHASRFGRSGRLHAGQALIGHNFRSCTGGYGARVFNGKLRGIDQYKYFVLTAAHCYKKKTE